MKERFLRDRRIRRGTSSASALVLQPDSVGPELRDVSSSPADVNLAFLNGYHSGLTRRHSLISGLVELAESRGINPGPGVVVERAIR